MKYKAKQWIKIRFSLSTLTIKCFVLLQLLQALRNTKVNINGTKLQFDGSGNPNVGYNLIQLMWKNSTLKFVEVGSFTRNLIVNMSLFKWHTENSEVNLELEFWIKHVKIDVQNN